MATLRLSWRQPADPLALSWRGPESTAMEAASRSASVIIAAIIGPPGPVGPEGPQGAASTPTRFDVVAPAGTWVIAHGLGYAPIAEVYDAAGNYILADKLVDATYITVTFGSPSVGFVLTI